MAIKDWPEGDRPRERLLRLGAAALSDTELLAIFLRTGIRGKSALDLAREVKSRFGSLSALFAARAEEIDAVPGLGVAKLAQLKAVQELAYRALGERLAAPEALSSPDAVKAFLRLRLQHLEREVFMVLFLNAQNALIAAEELFAGTLTQTSVYPREVVKRALFLNASAVILAHNHPSGIAEPSRADEALTAALRQALALVDVRVLDHVVVGRGTALSFAERGLL
jgi:DNA repair protein RadC